MCNDQPTGGGVQSPPCSSYPDYASPPCWDCSVQEHSVSCCAFWSMVYAFPYVPSPPVSTPLSFSCDSNVDPTLLTPGPKTKKTSDIAALIENADYNYSSVLMSFKNDPIDPSTNADIELSVVPTAKPPLFNPGIGSYNQSIALFQGLVNEYQNGLFNFYKAQDPQSSNYNVTFYVIDLNGKLPNYYCDITVLYP